MIVQTWADLIVSSFQTMWVGFSTFVPKFIGALIVFIVGLIVAKGLGQLVERVIDTFRLDKALERVGFKLILAKAGLKLRSGRFLGEIVRWFLILVFLLAVTNILGLPEVTNFLRDILFYIPSIIIAVLILAAGIMVSGVLERLVKASVAASGISYGNFLGVTTRWVIMIAAFLAALTQLGIAVNLIQTVITGIIAMLAIAGGLAFGLGGRDLAHELLADMRREIADRNNKHQQTQQDQQPRE